MKPVHCLCGCRGKPKGKDSRFLPGHDKRTEVRLERLSKHTANGDDGLVLSKDLLDFYEQDPDFCVVGDWYAHHVLALDRRGSNPH